MQNQNQNQRQNQIRYSYKTKTKTKTRIRIREIRDSYNEPKPDIRQTSRKGHLGTSETNDRVSYTQLNTSAPTCAEGRCGSDASAAGAGD